MRCSDSNCLAHHGRFGFVLVIVLLLLSSFSHATDSASPEEPESQPMTSDGAVKTGKGPGMGHDYQKNTPGPGKGKPQYKGGHVTEEQIENKAEDNNAGMTETDEPVPSGTEANGTESQPDVN